MLHRGFLHRDVGIPAVFLLPDPVEMTPFVPGRFEHVLQEAQVDETLQDQVGRLRKAMADLDIAGSCRGVIQPSDMAVEMKDYYTSCKNAHQPVSLCSSVANPKLHHTPRITTSSCLLDY